MTVDKFGVLQLYPTIEGGREWYSTKWANGKKRTITKNNFDTYDSKFGYTSGDGIIINGDGTATIPTFHSSHRVFVDGPWLNTEMTTYFKVRGKCSSFQMRSRSNHHGVKNLPYGYVGSDDISCGFGNYKVGWGFDRNIAVCQLEIIHDLYTKEFNEKPCTLSKGKWLGFKQITRTQALNKIRLEGWFLSDISNQNGWVNSTAYTFDGKNAAVSSSTLSTYNNNVIYCKDRGDKISATANQHQVWLKPSKWCWIRINNADDVDLKYFSVREIAPL